MANVEVASGKIKFNFNQKCTRRYVVEPNVSKIYFEKHLASVLYRNLEISLDWDFGEAEPYLII